MLNVPNRCVADAQALQRWSLDAARLPDGCDIRFAGHSFWREYLWQIVVALAVVTVQTLLIATLLFQRRSNRRTVAALVESDKRMSLASHAAKLWMWTWKTGHDGTGSTPPPPPRAGLPKDATIDVAEVLATVHPADRDAFDQAVRRAVGKDEELDIEYRAIQPDGEVRWIASRGRLQHGNSQRLLGVALDIPIARPPSWRRNKIGRRSAT